MKEKIIVANPGFWALYVSPREGGKGAVDIDRYPILAWSLSIDSDGGAWSLAIFEGQNGGTMYHGIEYPNGNIRAIGSELIYEDTHKFRCHMQDVFKYESPI